MQVVWKYRLFYSLFFSIYLYFAQRQCTQDKYPRNNQTFWTPKKKSTRKSNKSLRLLFARLLFRRNGVMKAFAAPFMMQIEKNVVHEKKSNRTNSISKEWRARERAPTKKSNIKQTNRNKRQQECNRFWSYRSLTHIYLCFINCNRSAQAKCNPQTHRWPYCKVWQFICGHNQWHMIAVHLCQCGCMRWLAPRYRYIICIVQYSIHRSPGRYPATISVKSECSSR